MVYQVIALFAFVLSHVTTYIWTITSKQDGLMENTGKRQCLVNGARLIFYPHKLGFRIINYMISCS
jgi:hypothetical protein